MTKQHLYNAIKIFGCIVIVLTLFRFVSLDFWWVRIFDFPHVQLTCITATALALYFIIDNNIESNNEEINKYFDILINEVKLDKEIKNLIIFKKGLFNSDFETENNLISILNPLINSKSVWKSHALYLMAEYFYSKNQKQKAKEFYNQILTLENSNENIKLEVQKKLRRDFSE